MLYAEIAVNVPVRQTFHYYVPEDLARTIKPGHLVRIAFGTAIQPGIVVALHTKTPVKQTKPILERLDPTPVVQPKDIELAKWMSQTYFAPLSHCLWLMLPPGITGKRDDLVTLLAPADVADTLQQKIITLLQKRGALRGEQIQRSLKTKTWKYAVQKLLDMGIVKRESILTQPKVKPLTFEVVSLAIHPDRIPQVRRYLGKSSKISHLLEAVLTMADENDDYPAILDVLALPGVGEATLNGLIESGTVTVENGTHIIPPDDIDQGLFDLRGGEQDHHVLQVLAREDQPVDVSWVYAQTGATRATLKRLAEHDFIQLGEKRTWRDSLINRDFVPMSAPTLTSGQREVWRTIRGVMDTVHNPLTPTSTTEQNTLPSPAIFLLHGVTGSGKTEIYLRAIEKTLSQGKQAIFLVPEIALTAQTVRRVMARFPGKVAVVGESGDEDTTQPGKTALIHSKLHPGERYDTWQRARAGEIDIIVGTRSALFTPMPNVGLIVLDEEHDQSYKQSPPNLHSQVYYHTRDVAERMMRDNKGVLILGSATPSVESYFRAKRGDITYLQLPDRIMGHRIRIEEQSAQERVKPHYESAEGDALTIPLPPVTVVDMRNELKAGNTNMFSLALQDALATTLARGEQAILFLNRRGTSTYVFCRDCGTVANCPKCNLPMTYHTVSAMLHCHYCDHRTPSPTTCPECASKRIKFFGAGTQQVESTLNALFADAISLRWDADTTAQSGAHDILLQRFANRQANVLIGTQMIAKGLDLPLVTLVGVVSADVGLYLPDFRAGERTFQLLTQVAGRAGRGLLGGRVILQTYQPEHYAIVAAAKHDYAGFYEKEVAYRQNTHYPPSRRLVRILFRNNREEYAKSEAQRATMLLRQRIDQLEWKGTEIIGPVPCFFSRLNRVYRWHLLLRGNNPAALFQAHPDQGLEAMEIARSWYVDVDPVDVL